MSIRINKEILTKMVNTNPGLANEWCLIWSGFTQYANHPNGYHSQAGVIFKNLSDDNSMLGGFKTKGEWRHGLSSTRIKSLNRKSPNGTYGCKSKSIKVSELLKVIDKGWDLYSSNCVLDLWATTIDL